SNLSGQVILEQQAEKTGKINTSDWPAGVYIISLSNENETIRQKFVIE
ncbi:MAG: T9SS type A sorting domain-containing protein, partial [Bacteroidales bacterium]|nr:T9SS type A sorting domain-containing protein [Bacteroidales bacterium]